MVSMTRLKRRLNLWMRYHSGARDGFGVLATRGFLKALNGVAVEHNRRAHRKVINDGAHHPRVWPY